MAHFFGRMTGKGDQVTRTGTKNSGITANVQGWGLGIIVDIQHVDGQDVARIYKTGGGNGKGSGVLILTVKEEGE